MLTTYKSSIFSIYIITLPIFSSKLLYCISAVEKDRDPIFTTITTIWKPDIRPQLHHTGFACHDIKFNGFRNIFNT
jgi:hypothetical protein